MTRPLAASELGAAIEKLAQSRGYQWDTAVTLKGGPGGDGIKITGNHSMADGTLVQQIVEGKIIQVARKGRTSVASAGEDWLPLKAFSDDGNSSVAAREMAAMPAPHEELGSLLARSTAMQEQDDGSFQGTLDAAFGLSLALNGMRHRAPALALKSMKCEGAEIRVWLRQGALMKYEVRLKVSLSMGLLKKEMLRTAMVTLDRSSSASVKMPPAAKEALNGEKP
jgi:hypothetical protein